ncbi:hypothetical protein DFJ63DRAFT_135674 [Scheffersomyces coipomensis]|uniref:uncharacterized protein n=1 Tax=Scheffersomyces coipomensis TaxID=1788519 RepID=UPI00315D5203
MFFFAFQVMLLKYKRKKNLKYLTKPEIFPLAQFIWHIKDLDIYDLGWIFSLLSSAQLVEFLHGCNQLAPYRQHVVDFMCGRTSGFNFLFGDKYDRLSSFNVMRDINGMAKLLSIPNLHFRHLKIIITAPDLKLLDKMVGQNFQHLQDSFDEISLEFLNSTSDGSFKALQLTNLVKLNYTYTNLTQQSIDEFNLENSKLVTLPNNLTELTRINSANRFIYLSAQYQNLTVLHFEKLNFKEKGYIYEIFEQATQLITLKALDIGLTHLYISKLPRNLLYLDLSNNTEILEIENNYRTDWPQSLKEISMESCGLTNTMYFDLFKFDLPPTLVSLNLNSNMFEDYSVMGKIPQTLESFSIGYKLIEPDSYYGERHVDHKLFDSFLPSLKSIQVKNYRFEEKDRIEFPDSITKIGIQYSCIFDGKIFHKYPNNLTSLDFEGCELSRIDLSKFSALEFLDLSPNLFKSFKDIKLPINLEYLQISNNKISKLKTTDPLFSHKSCLNYVKLKTIDLSSNLISSIDQKIELPPNLKKFLLSNNNLLDIVIPHNMSNHSRLTELDLSENELKIIEFQNSGSNGSCFRLNKLNLSLNKINMTYFSSKYTFNIHKRIEKGFGKALASKKENINSVHYFY